jgi:hypothetical protein
MFFSSDRLTYNVSICVRAGLPKPRPVPDSERTKDTKTLDYASTPLDANTLLAAALELSLKYLLSFVLLFQPLVFSLRDYVP